MKLGSLVAPILVAAVSVSVPRAVLAEDAVPAESAAPAKAETRAEVPALDEFHDVIRTIWHDAWPRKDVATLRELLPEVERGAAAVSKAKLPGILRDKQAAWDEGLEALQSAVSDYAGAAEAADEKRLLDAAERLHARYESMVRIIRPALPELDAFHVVLYQLYHYDMPSGDAAAMRATISRLLGPMAALQEAKLPARMKSKEKEFLEARGKLSESVSDLAKAAETSDPKQLQPMIERVHDRYQTAANVCE